MNEYDLRTAVADLAERVRGLDVYGGSEKEQARIVADLEDLAERIEEEGVQ